MSYSTESGYLNPCSFLPAVGVRTVVGVILVAPATDVIDIPEMLGLIGRGDALDGTGLPSDDMVTLMGMN